MSRLTGADAYGLIEAYNNVYAPQELTEEQVWEEVENWVNSLLEEGYDLSDYTWEEMYESYIEEASDLDMGLGSKVLRNKQKAERSTAQRQVQAALGQGKGIDVKGATSGADQGRGFGVVSGGRQGIVVNKPLKAGETQQINVGGRTLFPAQSGNRTVYLPSKDAKPATPLFKSSTKPTTDKPTTDKPTTDKPTTDKPTAPTRTPAVPTATRPAAPKVSPSTPAKPAGPAMGKLGGTTFERRTPTSAELKAAQAARASGASPEKALQAAKSAGAPKVAPSNTLSNTVAAASKPAAFSPAPEVKATNTIAASPKPTPLTPRQQRLNMEMEYDTFDTVLEHLVSEGYADTNESALVIMANMSEEWRQSILDEGDNYDKNRQRAAKRAAERNAARDRGQTGNVPGVGYVTPRRERETYRDSGGVERHTSGAKMPKKEG
jgi:hypothetical protein